MQTTEGAAVGVVCDFLLIAPANNMVNITQLLLNIEDV